MSTAKRPAAACAAKVDRDPAESVSAALSDVDTDRRPAVKARIAQMPTTCRLTYLKAATGKGSPRNAIKAFCMECVGWVRPEVTACTATACPLYSFRPF